MVFKRDKKVDDLAILRQLKWTERNLNAMA